MKKITALLLALLILCASALPALAAPPADAAMRLSSLSGTVTVRNASGTPLEASEGMALYNGYTVETGAASTALIALDDSKELTLDSRSICSVKHSDKTAEAFLVAGMVFFKTARPLRSDEAFILRSQDIVNSVRGSFGSMNTSSIMLIYGSVNVETPTVGRRGTGMLHLESGQGASLDQTSGGGTGSNGPAFSVWTLDSEE